MLKKIESLLEPFKNCFSREGAFKWFVVSVISFMLRGDRLGVTSFIRDLALQEKHYENLIHFFHSTSYSLSTLREKWYETVSAKAPLLRINGRAILIGDGVKQCKEGRCMPGVKKMAQESETCSKPEYIFGHMFGAVGVVVASKARRFCLPLKMNIQDGIRETASWEETKQACLEICGDSHIEQMVECGFEAARKIGKSFLLLDRYFLTRSALKVMNRLNGDAANPEGNLIEIVTKAKCNYTAYRRPYRKKGAVGRPPLHGSPVKIFSFFNQKRLFQSGTVNMYGKQENISYYSHKLLWGQGLYQELLFVFVEYDGKKSVLVSTDTTLDAFTVVELYAIRFGIEELFREYKQQVGGFSYHFWTASMPKLNHYSKKTDPDPLSEIRDSHSRNKILAAIRASEMFVFCSSVAMGILQLLALDNDFVKKFVTSRYLRTRSQEIPSEGTVMYYLRKYIFLLLGVQPDSFITQYIREKQQRPKTKDNKPDDSVAA